MATYLKTADSDWYRNRLGGVLFCVLIAFVLLGVRLFYLQVIRGEEFRRLSENNSIRLQLLDAPRGLVFDRNGVLLVDNRPSFDLSIIKNDAKPVDRTLGNLARFTGLPEKQLKEKLAKAKGISAYQPILLNRDIGWDMMAAVEAHRFDLPGVMLGVAPLRNYVFKKRAAHLIGYLGEISPKELEKIRYRGVRRGDYIGKFGVEKAFEDYLRGQRGGRQVEVNATGQVVRVMQTVEPKPGSNLYLTIENRMQAAAETLLGEKAGAVVAIEPDSGRLLVLASSPSYDQNAFVEGMSRKAWKELISNPLRPMRNKALQGEYPPASTYKIITALAGLEEGVIDENTTFDCPGYLRYGDRDFRCWKKGGHGTLNVVQAIEQSCDVFFYHVGQKLDVDKLAWYAKGFGLAFPTGMPLGQEGNGLIPTAAWKKKRTGVAWQGGETLSVAIGQGYNLVTPIQMAVLIATIANGGQRYRPIIVDRIETAQGEVVYKPEAEIVGRAPLSPKTIKLIREGLWRVVNGNHGTARRLQAMASDISGKTGTAQVIGRKTDETQKEENLAAEHKSHAWFVAFAPSERPRIAVAVIVEHGEHGSSVAAPIAGEIIRMYLKEIEPGEGKMAQMEAPVP